VFLHLTLVSPVGADFEYLDALPIDTECKINLGTDTRRWSSLFYELDDQLLASLRIEFTERHD
jgi:hypothetical protein